MDISGVENMGSTLSITLHKVLATYKSREHGIKALRKYAYWFPLYASSTLAGITADLMGDGRLQGPPKWRLDYCSTSCKELHRFNREVFSLFRIKGKIRLCTTNAYHTKNLGINNKPLARVLYLIGVPTGAKVASLYTIPDWILKDKRYFARFVNRLFSCEGCVDIKNKYIEIQMYKSIDKLENGIQFFQEIKKYLYHYFLITSTNPFTDTRVLIGKSGQKTKGIRLKIKHKDSLNRFEKYIGIDNTKKMKRLRNILSF